MTGGVAEGFETVGICKTMLEPVLLLSGINWEKRPVGEL